MARKRILSTLDTSITYDALGLDIAKEEALRGFEWVSAWLSGIIMPHRRARNQLFG